MKRTRPPTHRCHSLPRRAATAQKRAETHTLSVLVDNEPGVLARVIGLFSGRGYNIESLTVSETEHAKHLSLITIVTTGTPMVIEQIKNQLDRLVPIHRVVDMTLTGNSIERELAMVKVRGQGRAPRRGAAAGRRVPRPRHRRHHRELRVRDHRQAANKIEQFIALMLPLGLVEVARTGIAAIARGPEGMCDGADRPGDPVPDLWRLVKAHDMERSAAAASGIVTYLLRAGLAHGLDLSNTAPSWPALGCLMPDRAADQAAADAQTVRTAGGDLPRARGRPRSTAAGMPATKSTALAEPRTKYHACLLRSRRRPEPDQGQEGRHHRLWQPGPRPRAQPARFRRQGRRGRAAQGLGRRQEGRRREVQGHGSRRGRQMGRRDDDADARRIAGRHLSRATSPPT